MKVYLIGKTILNPLVTEEWLRDLGVSEKARSTLLPLNGEQSEKLVELAGRRCYKSFEPGLNSNVTKIREDPKSYMENILKSQHGSVLEHITLNFAIEGISRVLTHELVRHRVGTAISQESQRYVALDDIQFFFPPELEQEQFIKEEVDSLLKFAERTYKRISKVAALEEKPFHVKKAITSALRRIVPQGVLTGMVWSANLRTLRTVIEQRTSLQAESEIRTLFQKIGSICQKEYPLVFQDFEESPEGEWKPKYSKI